MNPKPFDLRPVKPILVPLNGHKSSGLKVCFEQGKDGFFPKRGKVYMAVECEKLIENWIWNGERKGLHMTKYKALKMLDALKKQVLACR